MSGTPRVPALRQALTLLTVLPIRADAVTPQTARRVMCAAPGVGLLVGGAAAVVLVGARAVGSPASSPLLPAALAIATAVLLTRGLHLDGLADTVDGLGSMRPADEARAVMRQPDIGPFGVTALLLVLLVQVAALSQATAAGRGVAALLLAAVTGRLAATLACTPSSPAADERGLGAMVGGTVRRVDAAVLTSTVFVGAMLIGLVTGTDSNAASVVRCCGSVAAGLAVAHLLRRHAVRRLGGVTGDVLGALIELAQTAVLVGMAL